MPETPIVDETLKNPATPVPPTPPTPPTPPAPAPVPPTPPTPPAEPVNVTIPKDVLDRMLAFMDSVPKQIERAIAGADKSRLFRYDVQNMGEISRTVLLSTYNGKIVTSWRMIQNNVVQDTQNRWYEEQSIEIMTEDLEKKVLKYKPEWINGIVKIDAEIMSMFSTPEGQNMIRVRIPAMKQQNGEMSAPKELDIDERFVN